MKTKTSTRLVKRSPKTVSIPQTEPTVNVNVAPNKLFILLAFVALLGVIFILGSKKYKGLIVAGKVNGKIVTRWELEKVMNDRFAKTVFDDLASSVLINQLADENGVVVSDGDVSKEIAATEQRLGGKEALQATLDRMGYTTARFNDEMRTQVVVQKLSEKLFKIDVTDEEVKKFFDDNKTLFPEKKFDDVKADIKQNLVQQKVQQEFSTWFADQKKKANIQTYI